MLAIGVEPFGQQIVDGDVMARDFKRQPLHRRGQAAARAGGQRHMRAGSRYHRGRDVDDASEAPLLHRRQHRADQHQRRNHVGLDHSQPAVALNIGEIAGRGACIVVDENVGRGTGREQSCLTVRGRDVSCDRDHITACNLSQLGGRLLEFCRIAPVNDDVDAFLR